MTGLLFLGTACVCIFIAVQVMFEYRCVHFCFVLYSYLFSSSNVLFPPSLQGGGNATRGLPQMLILHHSSLAVAIYLYIAFLDSLGYTPIISTKWKLITLSIDKTLWPLTWKLNHEWRAFCTGLCSRTVEERTLDGALIIGFSPWKAVAQISFDSEGLGTF